jgi:hypothetical protein
MLSRIYDRFDDAERWDRLMPDESAYNRGVLRRFKMQQRQRRKAAETEAARKKAEEEAALKYR